MADNTTIAYHTEGDTIATDDLATLNDADVSGVKVQRTKVGYGGEADLRDVSEAYPLPVDVRTGATLIVLLQSLVKEQQLTNTLLRKIYQ
jgi:hypothetical protein